MITAGITQGRNGGVALIQDDRLVLHTEVRQLDNNPRHAALDDLDLVPRLLGEHTVDDVDGWAAVCDDTTVDLRVAGRSLPCTGYPRGAALAAAAYCLFGEVAAYGRHRVDALGRIMLSDEPVDEVWVPPLPEDTCAAIGVAALHAFRDTGLRALSWRTQLGPELVRHAHVPDGWRVAPCRPEELARLLARTGRPAVVLHGRAKPGFSSLGSRCALIPVVEPLSKPAAAAICLAAEAAEVFEPGTADPYALLDHRIRPQWAHRVPGLEPSVRVQTVSMQDDRTLATLLDEYRKWTGGVPVLGITDAHFDGCGPFPDAASAMRWGVFDVVWADNVLYRRAEGRSDRGSR
jgi:hypothetical protein